MGSNKETETDIESHQIHDNKVHNKFVKKTVACFVSFLVSLAGGFALAWWRCEYEPQDRELWMVPFGLVLLVTPAIVWFSVVFSTAANQRSPLQGESDPDPEK